MTNSRYRCLGCKQYMPAPPFVRVGLGGVCSQECSTTVRTGGPRASQSTPKRTVRDEIPLTTRANVLLRDNYRCRWCGSNNVHLHHIRYRSEGVDHSEHNLIALCPFHHAKVHSDKRHWKPVLLAVIWNIYTGHPTTVPQVCRTLDRTNA